MRTMDRRYFNDSRSRSGLIFFLKKYDKNRDRGEAEELPENSQH